jgi:hypothetical protein
MEAHATVVDLCIGVPSRAGAPTAPSAAEWERAESLLLRNNVAGVVLGLPAELRESLPAPLARTLRARLFDLSLRRDRVLMSVEPVLRALQDQHVDFLVFKGPTVARLYERPANRMYGDIDLLVRPGDARRARSVLESIGLEMAPENRQPWGAFDRFCREGVNLSDGGTWVDLHHRIPPWCFSGRLTFDALDQRGSFMEIGEVTVRVPSEEDAAVIGALAVLNDLYKGQPALMTWRDLSVLLSVCGRRRLLRSFDQADLAWLGEIVVRTLDPGRREPQPSRTVAPPLAVRLRLSLLGWNGSNVFVRHPLGWVARLSVPRGLLFTLGSLIPSFRYARTKHGGYRRYWRKSFSTVFASAHGVDFRFISLHVGHEEWPDKDLFPDNMREPPNRESACDVPAARVTLDHEEAVQMYEVESIPVAVERAVAEVQVRPPQRSASLSRLLLRSIVVVCVLAAIVWQFISLHHQVQHLRDTGRTQSSELRQSEQQVLALRNSLTAAVGCLEVVHRQPAICTQFTR